MHKITLVTIGRLKENWAREACAFYADRLEHAVKLTIAELPASRETDPLRQVDDESRRLLKFIEDLDADVWVLDERGTALTSPAFAEIVASAKDAGRAGCPADDMERCFESGQENARRYAAVLQARLGMCPRHMSRCIMRL